jgi:fructose-bisphosphate aldolase, class II
VKKLFKYCQENNFAIPAINVTSSSTVVASLEAARDSKSAIILQVSQGGAVGPPDAEQSSDNTC